MEQSLSTLYQYRYSLHYREEELIEVSRQLRQDQVFQSVGSISVYQDDVTDQNDHDMVWESCGLSKVSFRNSSLAQSSDINYGLLRSWLSQCDINHSRCASNRLNVDQATRIRLIDVIEHKIVHGKLGDQYFALSYVWGGVDRLKARKENLKVLEKTDSLQRLSASIPRTVHDAMNLVRKIGFRFLWVDSLCIVQDDLVETHDQISMMHEIYSAAYATIVQHTGCDANAGLPGVRTGSRSLLATKVHIDETILMAQANYTVPDVLNKSIHSTRGWTYQEVLLSTRCLHFFDKHVTFVCPEQCTQDWNATWLDSTTEHRSRMTITPQLLWQMNPLSLSPLEIGGRLSI